MKTALSILFSLICFIGFAQKPIVTNRSTPSSFVLDARWGASLNMKAPVYDDTTAANTTYAIGLDSAGSLIFTRDSSFLWVRHTGKYWQKVGVGTGGAATDTIFFETPLRVVDNVVYIDPVSETDSGYVTPAMFVNWNNKVDSVGLFSGAAGDTLYYFIGEERNLGGIIPTDYLDSATLRNDSLFTYTGGVESYRGKVSGGGGGTLQGIMTGANRDASGGTIILGSNTGGVPIASGYVIAIGDSAAYAELGAMIAIGASAGANSGAVNGIHIGDGSGYASNCDSCITIGRRANGMGLSQIENSVAIGTGALVTASNSIVLGGIAGVNSVTTSAKVGIGTTAPATTLHVVGDARFEGNGTPGSGKVATGTDALGNWTWQTPASGGITTAQLTDSLNAREPRYKFRDDSTGNAGYTTLYQNGLKANTASPTFTGTVTTPMLQVTGRTSLQGVNVNKDSLPVTTTNRWAVTVDTPTNTMQRFDLERKADTFNQTFTGRNTFTSTTSGLIIPRVTTAQMNAISSPTAGEVVFNTDYGDLYYYNSDWGWIASDNSWRKCCGVDEFWEAAGPLPSGFLNQAVSGGTVTYTNAGLSEPGVVSLSTSTSSTGRASIYSDGTTASVYAGGAMGRTLLEARVRIPTLSNSTETFSYFFGISANTTTQTLTNGAYFLYDSSGTATGSAASGRWQVVTGSSGNRSYTTTSIQVTANQFYKLKMILNAAGTQIDFYIDDVLVKSETNNINLGGGITSTILKSNGTTARTAQVGYIHFMQKFATPR